MNTEMTPIFQPKWSHRDTLLFNPFDQNSRHLVSILEKGLSEQLVSLYSRVLGIVNFSSGGGEADSKQDI